MFIHKVARHLVYIDDQCTFAMIQGETYMNLNKT